VLTKHMLSMDRKIGHKRDLLKLFQDLGEGDKGE
jgi:hypothetical protein